MEQKNRLCVFIDASNLWEAQKAKGKFFDYEKLKNFLKNKFQGASIEIFYYTAFPADGTRDYSLDGKHKFFTYLKKGLGFIFCPEYPAACRGDEWKQKINPAVGGINYRIPHCLRCGN